MCWWGLAVSLVDSRIGTCYCSTTSSVLASAALSSSWLCLVRSLPVAWQVNQLHREAVLPAFQLPGCAAQPPSENQNLSSPSSCSAAFVSRRGNLREVPVVLCVCNACQSICWQGRADVSRAGARFSIAHIQSPRSSWVMACWNRSRVCRGDKST